MTCAKCGSPMVQVLRCTDFTEYHCFAAAHSLRVGAPAPDVDERPEIIRDTDPLTMALRRRPRGGAVPKYARAVYYKPKGLCSNKKCKRPAHPGHKQCEPCILIRRAAVERHRLRMAELEAQYQERFAHA
jgi:hypothetical protein